MVQPFEEYLKYIDFSLDSFAECLEDKNDQQLERLLKPLMHYGMISVLVPLNEFYRCLSKEDELPWWNKLIGDMDKCQILVGYEKDFHDLAVEHANRRNTFNIPYPWSYVTSYAKMQEMIWSIYKLPVESLIRTDRSLIGLIIPGLYQNHLDFKYLEFIDQNIIPSLVNILDNDLSCVHPLSKNEKAVIRIILRILTQELGWRYYSDLSQKVNLILHYNEEAFYNLKSNEYKELLLPCCRNCNIEGYVTVQWASNIERLSEYVDLLSMSGFSSGILKHVIPILYQCVSMNERATEIIIDLFKGSDDFIHKSDLLLIALYRAVVVERYDKRSMLYHNMLMLWGTNRIANTLLNVISNIICFCRQISDEIPKRFEQKSLDALIDSAEDEDKYFYYKYRTSSYDADDHDDDIGNLSRLSTLIFENHAMVAFMEGKWKEISDENNNYGKRIANMYLFYEMFSMLTYKYDYEPRIVPNNCLDLLGIEHTENEFKAEIFDVYTYAQRRQLITLNNQYLNATKNLPYSRTVVAFEKLSFDAGTSEMAFKERIMQAIRYHEKEIEYHDRTIKYQGEKLEQLQDVNRERSYIMSFLLKYAQDDEEFNKIIKGVFIRNPDNTRELCDYIYDICKKNDSVLSWKKEDVDNLRLFGQILEETISNPSGYKNQISRESFLKALGYIFECVPGASTAFSATKAILAVKKGIGNMGIDG